MSEANAFGFEFEFSEGCDSIARECVAGLRTHGLRLRKGLRIRANIPARFATVVLACTWTQLRRYRHRRYHRRFPRRFVTTTDVITDVTTDVFPDILLVQFTLSVPHELLAHFLKVAHMLEVALSALRFRPPIVGQNLPAAIHSPVNHTSAAVAYYLQLSEHSKQPFTVSLSEGHLALVPFLHMLSNVRDGGEDKTAMILPKTLQVSE